MPRRLGNDLNKVTISDNISGSTIVLHYRMPTPEETMRYTNEITVRKRNQVVSQLGETRQKYGAKILAGFRDGDFEKPGPGGEYVPISSDPSSAQYDPEWQTLVTSKAPDLVERLAIHVFEVSASVEDEEEIEKNSLKISAL